MFHRGLTNELWWYGIFVGLVGTIGASFGYFSEALTIALLLCLAWTLYHLNRFAHWLHDLRNGSINETPLTGVWAELSDDIRFINQRHERDKARLQTVVNRIQEMTSALSDGVILINNRDKVEWWNKAAARLFDFRDMDRGHNISNILRSPKFLHYFEAADYREPLDMNSQRIPGRRLQFQVHPFGKGERLLVVRDITRVHKLEQMRRDFVANVSHELRTPLTVIRGYVETLSMAPSMPPVWRKALGQMQDQGQRMTSLINDLISLANLETESHKQTHGAVRLAPLVTTIFNDAKVISNDQGHDFTSTIDENCTLEGNEKELRSAISNLVFNAVKYSPNGGTIRVETEKRGNQFVVHVKDQGPGIDAIHIPRLTERFYRVDEGRTTSSGGTGLGLAIVKHVLLRHEGSLRISSQLGKGSTFSCYFPQSRLNPPTQ